MTADEANVEIVRIDRVKVVTTKLTREHRAALNAAVKSGKLEHMMKDGMKPEVYYHPSFRYLAIEASNKIVAAKIAALKSVCI